MIVVESQPFHPQVVDSQPFHQQLEQHVRWRTGRRIRNLAVAWTPHRVVLSGQATSYYVKQLAQHGIREMLPNVELENGIEVADRTETTAA